MTNGTPDTAWSATPTASLTVDVSGTRIVRAEVIDADGYLRDATLRLEVGEPPPPAPIAAAQAHGCAAALVRIASLAGLCSACSSRSC